MTDSDIARTIILTDDLGIKKQSSIPLKSQTQYLSNNLQKILNSNSTNICSVDTFKLGHVYFKDLFEKKLQEFEYIIYLASSTHLSNAYDDAIIARSNMLEKNRIFIINTKTISGGVLILKSYIEALLKEGLYIDEVIPKVESYLNRTKSEIYLRNTEKLPFQKPTIKIEDKFEFKKTYSLNTDIEDLVSDIISYEKDNYISKIYLTYTSKYLNKEVNIIKTYLEHKLRYFNQVEILEDFKDISGFTTINGIGLYLG
jgi:hypothetical protein